MFETMKNKDTFMSSCFISLEKAIRVDFEEIEITSIL